MLFTCYGCRGSYPVIDTNFMRYGGNTTCYFIEEKDTKIIIDGGSGITLLGKFLFENYFPNPIDINIFISHGHWDHIMGFPLFEPFYYDNNTFRMYAPGNDESDVAKMMVKLLEVSTAPVPFENLEAKISTKNLKSNAKCDCKDLTVETYQLNHPSIDLGYRVTSKITGKSITVLTDIAPIEDNYLSWGWKELALGREKQFEQEYYEGLVKFVTKTDLLIMDTHFTDEDIKGKRHWGHSTPTMAMTLAKDGMCDNLMLTHHNPEYCDDDMDEIFKESKKRAKNLGINLFIAVERESHEV